MEFLGVKLDDVSSTVYVGIIVVLVVVCGYFVYQYFYGAKCAEKYKKTPDDSEIDDMVEEINSRQAAGKPSGKKSSKKSPKK